MYFYISPPWTFIAVETNWKFSFFVRVPIHQTSISLISRQYLKTLDCDNANLQYLQRICFVKIKSFQVFLLLSFLKWYHLKSHSLRWNFLSQGTFVYPPKCWKEILLLKRVCSGSIKMGWQLSPVADVTAIRPKSDRNKPKVLISWDVQRGISVYPSQTRWVKRTKERGIETDKRVASPITFVY